MSGSLIVNESLILLIAIFIVFAILLICIPPLVLRLFTLDFFPFGPWRSGEPEGEDQVAQT